MNLEPIADGLITIDEIRQIFVSKNFDCETAQEEIQTQIFLKMDEDDEEEEEDHENNGPAG